MTRFMAPRYFEQEQHQAVEALLEDLDIGDQEGRRIFIIALEYELAEYERDALHQDAAPPPLGNGSDLLVIARSAETLGEKLRGLAPPSREVILERLAASDPFVRGHDHTYLEALEGHIERLADACDREAAASRTNTPGDNEPQIQFITVVAEAYWECFEIDPMASDCKPFNTLLEAVSEICQLGIRMDNRQLNRILQNARGGGISP